MIEDGRGALPCFSIGQFNQVMNSWKITQANKIFMSKFWKQNAASSAAEPCKTIKFPP